MTQSHIEQLFFDNGLLPLVMDCAHVGSTYILGSGADIDYVVLCRDQREAADRLHALGFVPDPKEVYDAENFISVRRGHVNLILTSSAAYFEGFRRAAEVCRVLQIRDKATRVRVHEIIRDGDFF